MKRMFLRWGENAASSTAKDGGITLSPGVMPSMFMIAMPPNATDSPPQRDADLIFGTAEDPDNITSGDTRLILANCRVAEGSVHNDITSKTINFVARDFRWRWGFVEPITEEWNRRDSKGNIVGEKKSARDIGQFLYDLLPTPAEKQNSDTAVLPGDEFPHIKLDQDRVNDAFYDLAMLYGLLICPAVGKNVDPDSDLQDEQVIGKTILFKTGEGAAILQINRIAAESPMRVIDRPEKLRLVGGKTIEQRVVVLEAVAWDTVAGEYKLVTDTTIPYRPSGGFYPGFEEEISDPQQKQDALDTVWKAYRLPATMTIGKVDNVPRIDAARRMLRHLVEKGGVGTGSDRQFDYLEPFITGRYATEEVFTNPFELREATTGRVEVGFRFDEAHAVLIFQRPVFDLATVEQNMIGATLSLTTAWEVETYTRDFNVAPGGDIIVDGFDNVRTAEVFEEFLVAADGVRTSQNRDEVQAAAFRRASAYAQRWARPTSLATNKYPGIVEIMPDGAIEQVTWTLDGQGPTTIVSWGTEHDFRGLLRRIRDRDNDIKKMVSSQREGIRLIPATRGAGEMLIDPENFSLSDSEETEVLGDDF